MAEVPKESMRTEETKFPSNAHKYRKESNATESTNATAESNSEGRQGGQEEQDATPKKDLSSSVKSKRRSFGKQFVDIFFRNGASPKEIKAYIINEMIIPAILENIADTITTAIDMRFFGDSGRTRRSRRIGSGGNNSRTSYGSYYVGDDRRDRMKSNSSLRNRNSVDAPDPLDDFLFDDQTDAELVLMEMKELLDNYDRVTVADYISLLKQHNVKVRDEDHTDCKWGWTDLSEVDIKGNRRNGYFLDLPREYPV